jgi:hypothetical protein
MLYAYPPSPRHILNLTMLLAENWIVFVPCVMCTSFVTLARDPSAVKAQVRIKDSFSSNGVAIADRAGTIKPHVWIIHPCLCTCVGTSWLFAVIMT